MPPPGVTYTSQRVKYVSTSYASVTLWATSTTPEGEAVGAEWEVLPGYADNEPVTLATTPATTAASEALSRGPAP